MIPAHNEESVIERCLASILGDHGSNEFEIIVVCNGCTDSTAEVARAFGPRVDVVETETRSKTNALNLGDERAHYFPRLYIDADIVLTTQSIVAVAEALRVGRWHVASPKLRIDLTGRNWAVRSFYTIWTMLPYFDTTTVGSGVYALSEEGRARFGRFPEIIADDGFVRLIFEPHERIAVASSDFFITPPRTLSGIIKIKTRAHKGNYQLAREYPQLQAHNGKSWRRSVAELIRRPWLWPAACVYAYVMTRAKIAAKGKLRNGHVDVWERDDESRN